MLLKKNARDGYKKIWFLVVPNLSNLTARLLRFVVIFNLPLHFFYIIVEIERKRNRNNIIEIEIEIIQ